MRFLPTAAIAALLCTAAAPATETTASMQTTTAPRSTTERIFPYPVHVDRLDNGLEVVLVPMSSNGLVAYWSIVRTGARDEYEPGHTGFAHFFEHMMFRGTEKYPQDVYNQMVTGMGANANAFTSDDLTAYHLAIASEDLERVMEIESDRFQNLSYAEEAFKTEAGAVYGEYRKNRTSPFFAIYEAVHQAAFTTHTYGHTAMGYEADIKAMPTMYDYSRGFFRRYYRPDNIVLLIVGDIDPTRTMDMVRRHYSGWQKGYQPPQVQTEPQQTEEKRIDVPYEGRSLPILWLAYKGPRFDPSDRTTVAADVLMDLAFGETSDIYRKLVLDEQTVEFLSANVNMNRDPGLIDIYTRVKDPAKVAAVEAEIDRVIRQFQETAPSQERLDDVKSRMKYQFLMNLQSPSAVAGALARFIAVTGDVGSVDRLYATYAQLTPEDVRTAARTFLVPTRRTVAVLKGQM